MRLEVVAATASKSASGSSSTVAFSWEQEPGVSKQSHSSSGANKPTDGGAPPRAGAAVSRRTPAMSSKKKPAPAPAAVATAHAHPHRLRVPPPPGGPGAPAASPPTRGRRKPRSRSRGVRPAEDPFLAAYLACTEDDGASGGGSGRGGGGSGRGGSGAQKLLGWAGLGLGLGLGMRGLGGLSCKSSCGAVEECVVRLAKIHGMDQD